MENYDENTLAKSFDYTQWKRLFKYIIPYKKHLFFLLVAAVVTAFFDSIFPLMTQVAIESFIEKRVVDGLVLFTGGFIILALIQGLFSVVYCKEAITIEMLVGRDMKEELFSHTQTLSLDYFNKTPVGFILARIMQDTNSIGSLFSWGISDFIFNLSYIIFAMVNMVIINANLAFAVILILPITYVIANYFQKKLLFQNRIVRRQNAVVTGAYNEFITGATTIKELDIQEYINQGFKKQNESLRDKTFKFKEIEAYFFPIVMIFSGIIISVNLGYGSLLVFNKELDVAQLSVFVSYSLVLTDPIEKIIKSFTRIISLQANVERVNALADTQPLVCDTQDVVNHYGDIYNPKTEQWEEIKGDIEFIDVSFKYPGSETYVLKNFNLKIKAGSSVAIVGHTGAGKSTLVNLVCRFFEPTSGTILIDGIDYRNRSLLWLQHNLSYVLQSPHLFSGTIEDNIKYSKPNATLEEVIIAAKKAQADGFITSLNQGYKTEIGEGGDKLSIGQKQLVSIARAILADGKILVMDEATSSVDTHTEQLINTMSGDLMKDKTTFIIAHRLSTIKNSDIILVVENGKIMESGNHVELLQKEGLYYQMYTGQWEEEEQTHFFEKL